MRRKPKRTSKLRRRHVNLVLWVGIVLGIGGLAISIGGHLLQYNGVFNWQQLEIDFYANAGTELISIAITIVVVDTLYARRTRREYKARLIREMGSGDRSTALRAVKELKEADWFYDGTLHNAKLWRTDLRFGQLWFANLESADLRAVNLREAELREANLRNTKLHHADLRGTDLRDADLTGARLKGAFLQGSNITLEQLQSVATLEGATMPDGSPYAVWRQQPTPVTLHERKIKADPIFAETPAVQFEAEPAPEQSKFVWFGVGILSAVFSFLLFREFQR